MESEKQQLSSKLLGLSFSINQRIVSYLSVSDLQVLREALEDITAKKCSLPNLVAVKLFFSSFLNFTDRSLYLSFYGDSQYLQIQQSHLLSLNYKIFEDRHLTMKLIFQQLRKELQSVSSATQIVSSLEQTLRDPEMPFPKMRKDSQAMFCNSNFQFFLADKLYCLQQPYFEPQFEDLNNFLEACQDCIKGKLIGCKVQQIRKISQVINAPYTITAHNYSEFLMNQCTFQNLVVCSLALIQNYVGIVQIQISSFGDPLSRFIEFTLRYCIFRNIVLALEEKLCELFSVYNRFCHQTLPQGQVLPQVSLWRTAMTMWHQTMKQHHEQNNTIYCYLLTKFKNRSLLLEFQETLNEFHNDWIYLRNKLSMGEYQIEFKQQFYCQDTTENRGVQDYFTKDLALYQQVLRQYTEYMVDISINEFTVHWCGHSKHQLDHPYLIFEQRILQNSTIFYRHIEKILVSYKLQHDKIDHDILQTLKRVYSIELNILNQGLVKSTTLNKLVQCQNQIIIKIISDDTSKQENNIESKLINTKFQQGDGLLLYSNNKYGIQFDRNMTIQQKTQYSISRKDSGKVMVKSTETSSSLNQDYKNKSSNAWCFQHQENQDNSEYSEDSANQQRI